MKKPEFYLHVHKAIRRRLYLAAILIGTTDFEDSKSAEAVRTELKSLFSLLRRHAEHENNCFHPLIRKFMPDLQLDQDHTDQDEALEKMEFILVSLETSVDKRALGSALYEEFNEFVTHSLEHMRSEERLMPRLWQEYSSAELAGAMQKVFASFTPAEIADSVTYFPQALNPQEKAMFGFV